MAVSGREDLNYLVSLGSAEDFDHSCEPCLTIGQHVEAHGYCVDCQECLCKNCFECHKRTKASRKHRLLDKNNFAKQVIARKDSEECTEKCSVHENQIINFFCSSHEELVCNDCIIVGHRSCKIDYIPEICAGIGDSEEYRDTVNKLNEKMEEARNIMKKAKIRDKEIDESHAGIIKNIRDFREEINDSLDQLQQEFQKEADKKKSNDKKLIQMILDECANISSKLKKLDSRLQVNKTSHQNGQLYIHIKRALCNLKSDELEQAEEILTRTEKQYSFKQNTNLENMLTKCSSFGELVSASLVTQIKKKTFKNLLHKEDINVRRISDKTDCWVTGCAALSPNKLVLADYNNSKMKVVDVQSKSVTEEKTLDSGPFDIAAMPRDRIAVTMPEKRTLFVMTTTGHLSTVRSIPVKGKCYGITHHQGYIYVVCRDPISVLALDTQGHVQNTISLDNDIFQYPACIVFSEDSKRIYISDSGRDCVVSITPRGDVYNVYQPGDLYGPKGAMMLDDGSLLVCGYRNGSMHHISGDLKQGQRMTGCRMLPCSICYSHHHDEVYIGSVGNLLKVFSMKLTDRTDKNIE